MSEQAILLAVMVAFPTAMLVSAVKRLRSREARGPFSEISVVDASLTALNVIAFLVIGLLYFIPVVSLIFRHWLALDLSEVALAAIYFALTVVAVGLQWLRRGVQRWEERLLFAVALILLVLCLLGVL